MALLFDNCYLYNRPETWVYGLAVQAEKWFDAEWGKEAFAGSVARRPRRPTPPPVALAATAPRPSAPPRKPAAPPKAKRAAAKAAPPRRPAGPKAGAGGGGGAVARTKSVNSYRNYQTLPADKQAALAEALQDEATLAAKMDGVVGILQSAGELPTNEDGEVELDLRSVHTAKWPLRGGGWGRLGGAAYQWQRASVADEELSFPCPLYRTVQRALPPDGVGSVPSTCLACSRAAATTRRPPPASPRRHAPPAAGSSWPRTRTGSRRTRRRTEGLWPSWPPPPLEAGAASCDRHWCPPIGAIAHFDGQK